MIKTMSTVRSLLLWIVCELRPKRHSVQPLILKYRMEKCHLSPLLPPHTASPFPQLFSYTISPPCLSHTASFTCRPPSPRPPSLCDPRSPAPRAKMKQMSLIFCFHLIFPLLPPSMAGPPPFFLLSLVFVVSIFRLSQDHFCNFLPFLFLSF